MYYLALDVGGTKTSAALFREDGTIFGEIMRRKSRTYDGEECVYDNTRQCADTLLHQYGVQTSEIIAMGIGGPGPLDCKSGTILHAPMMGWHHFPLAAKLQEDFHIPAFLDNDGNLGALAEQRCGLAKGKSNIGYMTVSTGIGGGLVLGGQLYHGASDGAGEFGHLSINPQGPRCPCGNYGCLELYASGTAIEKRLLAGRKAGVSSMAFTLSDTPGCRELAIAAEAGDSYALQVFDALGTDLGIGLTNIFNLFDLEMLVLGGGVTKAHQWFEAQMFACIEERCIQNFSREQVVFSQMNDSVVLYGAFYLAKEAMQGRNE